MTPSRRGKRLLSAAGLSALLGLASLGASAETLSISVSDYNAQALSYLKNTVVPAFESAHPGVKVQLTDIRFSTLLQSITAWVAAGTEPDVMQIGGQYIGLLAPQGIIQPLDAFVQGWPVMKDIPKAAVEDVTLGGHVYAVPYRIDQRTLVYRKDFFAKAGLDAAQPPATWDELAAAAQKLTIKDDTGKFQQSGYYLNSTDVSRYMPFMYQAGANFVSPDLRTVTIADAANLRAVQFWSDLVNRYGVSPPNGFGSITSTAAMDYKSPKTLGGLTRDSEKTIGIALPPQGPAGRSGALFVNKWAIGSQSRDPKLAWAWIDFVSQADVMAQVSRIANLFPPRFSMLRYSPWSDDPRWSTFFQATGVTEPLRGQVPAVYHMTHGEFGYKEALADILNNKKSPSVALREVQQTYQAQLDAFWRQYGKGG